MLKPQYRMIVFILNALLLLELILPSIVSASSSRLQLNNATETVDVYQDMDVIKDQPGEMTVEEVSSEAFTTQFQPVEIVDQKPGFFEMTKWLRFDVSNNSNHENWLLEFAFPLIYELDIYAEEESGLKKLHTAGARTLPFEEREIQHRNFVFNMNIKPGETQRYYVRAVGGGDLHPPINIWENDAFLEKSQIEFLMLGIFYGIVLVMILYNLFLYFSLRIRSYLYYVLVITCTLLGKVSINGIGFQYLWPDYPAWNVLSTTFWVSLGCVFILIFTRHFLDSDYVIPRFKLISYILIIWHSLVIAFLFISHYIALNMMVIGALCTFTSVLVVAFICLRRGARQARFYIAGWLIFLSGVLITILERAVVLPYTLVTEYAGQAALTLEVVLLSLALADKINIMRKEKEQAEQEAMENQLLAMENLKKADVLKDEFLAVTSHELRTPLHGMTGIAESLRDGAAGSVTAEMKHQLSMIITSGKRLTHLVDDILDLSRLKHDTLDLQIKPVHVKAVIDVVLAISQPLLHNKPVRLTSDVSNALPPVLADENRLQQIIYNLVDNAIKYTDEGKITISATVKGKTVQISIEDTGRGIPEDQMHTIFQPFQQGRTTIFKKKSGAGIGLNIMKQLVDLHDGTLEVESEAGSGTVFTVVLPVASEYDLVTEATVTREPFLLTQPEIIPKTSAITKHKSTILVADDEMVNLQVLINRLSLEGYDVLTASDGNDVLTQIKDSGPVDLLILDIMMPGMSGYEVCQRLRKMYTLMDLPILMLTAKDQTHDKLAAFEAGANDYITKPFDKQELLSRVKTLIRIKTLNEELIEINQRLEEKVQKRTQALENANQDLQKMNETLQEASLARRELLFNIAHELGTPVTTIHGYIQSLHEGIIDSNDAYYIELVQSKTKILDRLVHDLFDLAKAEAGQTSLHKQEVSVDKWLDGIFEMCAFEVDQSGRQFQHMTIPEDYQRFACLIDVERMNQVFSNLISNAVKYTSWKDGQITLDAVVDGKSQLLIICVKDNGVGIAEENPDLVFERFYKNSPNATVENEGGSGLGLAIVKQIIEGHNGEIWVESKQEQGATFVITLPVWCA